MPTLRTCGNYIRRTGLCEATFQSQRFSSPVSPSNLPYFSRIPLVLPGRGTFFSARVGSNPGFDIMLTRLAERYPAREQQGFGRRSSQRDIVTPAKEMERLDGDALVAIIERMVLDQTKEEDRGLWNNPGAHLFAKNELAWRGESRVQPFRVQDIKWLACGRLEARANLKHVELGKVLHRACPGSSRERSQATTASCVASLAAAMTNSYNSSWSAAIRMPRRSRPSNSATSATRLFPSEKPCDRAIR